MLLIARVYKPQSICNCIIHNTPLAQIVVKPVTVSKALRITGREGKSQYRQGKGGKDFHGNYFFVRITDYTDYGISQILRRGCPRITQIYTNYFAFTQNLLSFLILSVREHSRKDQQGCNYAFQESCFNFDFISR